MSEGFFSRGFRGRRQPSDTSGRLPPGQYACWCHISTSGRAPSGSGVCAWSTRMNRASGSRLATTITEIHGKKNAIGATKLATRYDTDRQEKHDGEKARREHRRGHPASDLPL